MSQLITNIKSLVNVREETTLLRGKELSQLPIIENAYLIIEEDEIADYGSMKDLSHLPSYFNDHFDQSDFPWSAYISSGV